MGREETRGEGRGKEKRKIERVTYEIIQRGIEKGTAK